MCCKKYATEHANLNQLKILINSNQTINLSDLSRGNYELLFEIIQNSKQRFLEVYEKIEIDSLPKCEDLSDFCNEKVCNFLNHVFFSTGNVNTLSAIRAIMYRIVDNPIGCTLISRILDKIENKMILFKIDGDEFIYLPSLDRNPMETIIITNIIFSGYKAQRQDITSYGPP